MYQPRLYRERMLAKGLVSFQVTLKETDLHVSATRNLSKVTLEIVAGLRADLESFIARQPVFAETFAPFDVTGLQPPPIVRAMAGAARKANVGPMAAVAGAVAEFVGRELLVYSPEVIVENGGDVFLKTRKTRTVSVFAGASPLSNRLGLVVHAEQTPVGICTSSGTVGHSISLGKADAVVCAATDTAFADAAATAIGNRVRRAEDIEAALEFGRGFDELRALVIIKDDVVGTWGEFELTPVAD